MVRMDLEDSRHFTTEVLPLSVVDNSVLVFRLLRDPRSHESGIHDHPSALLIARHNPSLVRLLDQLAQLPAAFARAQAGLWLEAPVTEPTFLKTQIVPLLDRLAPADDPSIARTFVSPLGGCSLQVFVWAPGSKTPIHDHTSWGTYYCVVGSVLEDRYKRLDDGTQLNRAHLRFSWRRLLQRTDRASTVAPYAKASTIPVTPQEEIRSMPLVRRKEVPQLTGRGRHCSLGLSVIVAVTPVLQVSTH